MCLFSVTFFYLENCILNLKRFLSRKLNFRFNTNNLSLAFIGNIFTLIETNLDHVCMFYFYSEGLSNF